MQATASGEAVYSIAGAGVAEVTEGDEAAYSAATVARSARRRLLVPASAGAINSISSPFTSAGWGSR